MFLNEELVHWMSRVNLKPTNFLSTKNEIIYTRQHLLIINTASSNEKLDPINKQTNKHPKNIDCIYVIEFTEVCRILLVCYKYNWKIKQKNFWLICAIKYFTLYISWYRIGKGTLFILWVQIIIPILYFSAF